jgi:alpha-D-ribose 1-methylphosphonate 5-triphosphate synthase subunit PhnH
MKPSEAQSQQTFRALMWAFSHPGRPYTLTRSGLGAFEAISTALLDLETSYYTSHPLLKRVLAHSGARFQSIAAAQYQFYPDLSIEMLSELGAVPVGSHADPDTGATLIIGCTIGSGRRLWLKGPGIAGSAIVDVDGLPRAFWDLRASACRYPLGWDIYLVARDEVVGLPRSTTIEVL